MSLFAVTVMILVVLSVPFVICGWQFFRGRWRELLAKYDPAEEEGVRVPKDNELRVAAGLFFGTATILTLPSFGDIVGRRMLSALPLPVEVAFGVVCGAVLLAALAGLLAGLARHFTRTARERKAGVRGTDGKQPGGTRISEVDATGLGDYDEKQDDDEARAFLRRRMERDEATREAGELRERR